MSNSLFIEGPAAHWGIMVSIDICIFRALTTGKNPNSSTIHAGSIGFYDHPKLLIFKDF